MSTNPEPSALEPGSIDWQWDDVPSGERQTSIVLDSEAGDRFIFNSTGAETVEIKKVRSSGNTLWFQPIPAGRANSAVLLLHAGKLYAALYSDIATGCRVLALDAASGALLWETPLK